MKKKLFSSLLILVCISSLVSAATWRWSSNYPEVTNFRYQVGDENPRGWVVVPATTTTITIDDVDRVTLYVQQSLDNGVSWSNSGAAIYIAPVKPLAVATTETPEYVEVEELVPEAIIEDEKVDRNDPVLQVSTLNTKKTGKPFAFGISFNPQVEYFLKTGSDKGIFKYYDKLALGLGLSLGLNLDNLIASKVLGLGFGFNVGATYFMQKYTSDNLKHFFDDSWTLVNYNADIMVRARFDWDNFNVVAAGGLGLLFSSQSDVGNKSLSFLNANSLSYGAVAELGCGMTLGRHFTVDLTGRYRFAADFGQSFGGKLGFGLIF